MTGLLTARDAIRDFLRKYDEITTPLIRFAAALIMFLSINSMYGYSSLFDKGIVVLLLSVISALVSDVVVVLLGGAVVIVNTLSVSVEVGAIFLILFLLMYCMYMRMFPECGWVLAFVPIMFMLKLGYAVPLVVVIFSGASAIVPTAFGVVLYYFAVYTREIYDEKMTEDETFQAYTYIIDGIAKNKEIFAFIIVAAVVILITYIIYRLPFDYSWYVAIGVGGLCNILFTFIVNAAVGAKINAGSLMAGSLLGIVIAMFVLVCKRIADYAHKESVQFEDDDYYYYVKAIPKYNSGKTGSAQKDASREVEQDYVAQRTAAARTSQNRNNTRNAADRNTSGNPKNKNSQTRKNPNR